MFSKSIVAAALVAGAVANPLLERGVCGDACAAAVTGKSALGDYAIRASHCKSFLATTVTPAAITVTATVTGTSSKNAWKRAEVTYCPNTVPVYATSACGGSGEGAATAAYSSACSCYGITGDSTTTLAPTTTTKTVYVVPTHASSCASSVSTVTVTAAPLGPTGGYGKTVTVTATTNVTVTASAPPAPTDSTCLTKADADYITDSFTNLLEVTNLCGVFNATLATELLASDFTDTSDSINFMAGLNLTTVTFPSVGAFIGGQGNQPCIPSVITMNTWFDCHSIVWRWRAFPVPNGAPVTGINVMMINDKKQIETNYSEFDNGAWLYNYGNPQCATSNSTSAPSKRSPAVQHLS